ncbi:MAG: hypothetical protein ABI604_20225 [Nitrospirota bacterium]
MRRSVVHLCLYSKPRYGFDGGRHRERPNGKSASAVARYQCGVVSRAGLSDGRRAGVVGSVSCAARAAESDRGRGHGVCCEAVAGGPFSAAHPAHMAARTTGREAVHQRKRRLSRTGGLSALATDAQNDRRTLGGGTRLAWLPALPAAGLLPVRNEACLRGGLLNVKRLAPGLLAPA